MPTKCYTHLRAEDRETLSLGLAQGHSLRRMARVLGDPPAPSAASRRATPRVAAPIGHVRRRSKRSPEPVSHGDRGNSSTPGCGRRHVATLMRRMGIAAVYRKPRTSQRHPAHTVYPYLLRNAEITRPNHVWAADITYIPMQRGFVYLFAVLDWASRRVLAWRLSNTLTTDFCTAAVQEAVTNYGAPTIFNTDQGCQFTSLEFTGILKEHGIQISMDGTGCWRDNVFVERLWKSIKYEEVYLHAYETVSAAHQGLERYLTFYNQTRPHRALDGHTPDGVYFNNLPARRTAA